MENSNIASINTKKTIYVFSLQFIVFAFIFIGLGYLFFFFKNSLMDSIRINYLIDISNTTPKLMVGPKLFWIIGNIFVALGMLNFLIFYGFIKGFKWTLKLVKIELIALNIATLSLVSIFMTSKLYNFLNAPDIKQYFDKNNRTSLFVGLLVIVIIGLFIIYNTNPVI